MTTVITIGWKMIELFIALLVVPSVLYLIRRWFAEHVLMKLILKSDREVASYLHGLNRKLGKGHVHKNPLNCRDGACSIL